MDASQIRYPETVHKSPHLSFPSFYLSKVSEMLWNTPKNQFGSNGVEWMLHNFGTPKQCIQARNTSFAFFLPVEGLRNAPKHSQTSFWVKWSRMDASQLWHPETVYSSPKHKFCIFVPVEGYRNAPKHSQTSFGSNGVERMLHNFDTRKQCIQARNTSFTSLYLSKVIEMLRNTPKHHFGSNGVEWMLHNIDTPKQCIQARNTSFTSCYLLKVSEILRNTPKHHSGSNGVEWMLHNFGTPK
jgi:hypothetical protein